MTDLERAPDWLDRILEWIARIERSLDGVTGHHFSESSDLIDVTAFRLGQIGEISKKLPSEIKDRHPEIEWRDMVDFRNFMFHEYHRADVSVIFGAATTKLAALAEACRVELARLEP